MPPVEYFDVGNLPIRNGANGLRTTALCMLSRPITKFFRRRLSRNSARKESFQLPRPNRVLKLADGLGFDLPDPLAGDLEDAPDFLQSVGVPVADPVAQLD